ncbi:MAG: hypothetical protein U9P71_05025 [Campylobacterota bacterium]|nr:hypothetical protein [Campylobacterota bacterium]
MKKLFFLSLIIFATLTFANSPLQRSTNFNSSHAGSYTLSEVLTQGVIMTNTSGSTWCINYQGQQQCETITELMLTISIDANGNMTIASDGDSLYAGSIQEMNIDEYTSSHSFTFTSTNMSLSYSDQETSATLVFKKTGAAAPSTPSSTNEAQTDYTKELQEQEYGSTANKAKIQEIKTKLLATTASSVDEVADGNGLIVTYKDGYSGLIYHAPQDSKGGSGSSTILPSSFMEKLKVFKRAATRSGSNKVLAIAAQYWDWGYNDDVPQLAAMLSANGFDVTYKKYNSPNSGSISDFQNWGDYAIVLISTHGIARDTRSRTTNSINMAVDLNIAPDDSSVSADDLKQKRLIEWDNCGEDDSCHKSLLATNLFFEKYLSSLPNTLVYVSACHVGKNNAMAEVIFEKGGQTMIGYSDLVQVSFAKEKGVDIFTRYIGNESLESIFSLPGGADLSEGYSTGIKESDDTPAEIVVYQKENASSQVVDYESFLSLKTYDIAGSFAAYDFNGVDKAFDWVFSTNNGLNFQLQGTTPSATDAFGWKKVDGITGLSPAWYMFPLGDDIDGDDSEAFDWIFISAASTTGSKAYKLAGAKADGTFEYSSAINLNYTITNNKVSFSK